MQFTIRGDKVKVTDAIREHIETKIGRLDKYLENPEEINANVVVRVRGIDQIVEVTIPVRRLILRGEESHKDLYAAIDLVTEKIERQIRKNKTKLSYKNNRERFAGINLDFDNTSELESEMGIVKRKQIEMKPMSEEEAVLQMELLGHSFFLYKDQATDHICVIYNRKDGNYGLIETI